MFDRVHNSTLVISATIVILHAALLMPASGQCESAKLLASDGAAYDRFGDWVAIEDDTAVIGAPGNDGYGWENCGSAYVFRYNGSAWIQEAILWHPDVDDWDSDCDWYEFGTSAGISGDWAVIGQYNVGPGEACLFRRSWDWGAWEPPLQGSMDEGYSVAISGDIVLFGAPTAAGAGAAYVFRWNGGSWQEEAVLLASDGEPEDRFGFSVAIDGDIAVIGSPMDDDNGHDSGSAYIFGDYGGYWYELAKFRPQDGAPGDWFGYAVGIDDDTIVVGARWADACGTDSGAAYVFRVGDQEAKLVPEDGAPDDSFGYSVAISADTAVIGARFDDDTGTNSGSAYVFRYDGSNWVEQAKLSASDGAPGQVFGCAVAVSQGVALIGARRDGENGVESGAAYVFDLDGSDCNQNGVCDDRDIADGTSEDCNENGIPDECDIADGTSEDVNGNGVPDECECVGDIDGDGDTDHADLGAILGAWDSQPGDPHWNPNADIDGDGHVYYPDLGILLADWGCDINP